MGMIAIQRGVLDRVVLRDEIVPLIEAAVPPIIEAAVPPIVEASVTPVATAAELAAELAAEAAATAAALAVTAEAARLRGLACLLRSGVEPMDGDLDMGNHRIVNEQHGGRP